MLKLTNKNKPGTPLYINALSIQAIYGHQGDTHIDVDENASWVVEESPEKINQMIVEATSSFISNLRVLDEDA